MNKKMKEIVLIVIIIIIGVKLSNGTVTIESN